ncbi:MULTISPECIES: hypothetical protein [Paenibacillus]|uniref:hypothetical protein n=1 Tax=Paenibacillus TaxID=44249 RepID=UPI00024F0130|nr:MULTISPECIES: hypothetical protein [Paenibacillus]EHS58066.1 hypothetical protein WG8_1325 [Paenibacillus sp. Aloe-11]MEC0180344.1 hypothetical protein [Paenibacillus peoriae]MEC0233211.1 hypothetical protein [Paenibacillus kribbensis]
MHTNREELQRILKQANEFARKQAKEAGASIYYIKNGKRVREDANGQKYEIVFDTLGIRKEYEFHE